MDFNSISKGRWYKDKIIEKDHLDVYLISCFEAWPGNNIAYLANEVFADNMKSTDNFTSKPEYSLVYFRLKKELNNIEMIPIVNQSTKSFNQKTEDLKTIEENGFDYRTIKFCFKCAQIYLNSLIVMMPAGSVKADKKKDEPLIDGNVKTLIKIMAEEINKTMAELDNKDNKLLPNTSLYKPIK